MRLLFLLEFLVDPHGEKAANVQDEVRAPFLSCSKKGNFPVAFISWTNIGHFIIRHSKLALRLGHAHVENNGSIGKIPMPIEPFYLSFVGARRRHEVSTYAIGLGKDFVTHFLK
ncbi:hypothetical protein NC653_040711 [Populus alba x Populus x berolinensis]|uniref:Uncharacterized protein n=1 Tax=Populus alba x Populus x berolinensis TaxID=444605 RepID=A0AAD6PP52_9ROSI|nr:hypothetical protein NC653_040711 [Populus alba x Populus x berolinensis]